MHLIDKDALLDGIVKDDPKHVLLYISQFPTVDPAKHEHWTRKKILNHPLGTWKTWCMCSGCRHTQLTESAFCGGCGARMDGDSDE